MTVSNLGISVGDTTVGDGLGVEVSSSWRLVRVSAGNALGRGVLEGCGVSVGCGVLEGCGVSIGRGVLVGRDRV